MCLMFMKPLSIKVCNYYNSVNIYAAILVLHVYWIRLVHLLSVFYLSNRILLLGLLSLI